MTQQIAHNIVARAWIAWSYLSLPIVIKTSPRHTSASRNERHIDVTVPEITSNQGMLFGMLYELYDMNELISRVWVHLAPR